MTAETVFNPRTTAPLACTHHWLVEPADGPTSRGRCKHCGSERRFANSTETATEEVLKMSPEASQPPHYHGWR
jgi:hypothetical protein